MTPKPPFQPSAPHSFVDKSKTDVPQDHRFAWLADKLALAVGDDVVAWASDFDELSSPAQKHDAMQSHQKLLANTPPPHACVLIAISDEDEPRILLTVRSTKLSSHAGEVSFVGGKCDVDDVSSLQVALREADEEVGLVADGITLLGYLPMHLSKKGLLVRPVVVSVPADTVGRLTANQDEIDHIFWVAWQD